MAANLETTPVSLATPVSKKGQWTGWVLSGLAILFLVFDGFTKVLKVQQVMQASAQLQFPEWTIPVIGAVLLFCTLIYAIPQTSVLGAVLLTGYLGGAVATQFRVGNPLFGYPLFPVYFGVLIWAGLLLREKRLRALIPFRS